MTFRYLEVFVRPTSMNYVISCAPLAIVCILGYRMHRVACWQSLQRSMNDDHLLADEATSTDAHHHVMHGRMTSVHAVVGRSELIIALCAKMVRHAPMMARGASTDLVHLDPGGYAAPKTVKMMRAHDLMLIGELCHSAHISRLLVLSRLGTSLPMPCTCHMALVKVLVRLARPNLAMQLPVAYPALRRSWMR